MTVRHIVSWKMNGETPADRARQAAEIADALRPLPQTVPGILALDVRLNEFNAEANWDLVLVSDHEDQAALDVYATHPEHLAVVALVKERSAGRAGVDFEL
ncbi:MAG: Dabb family protein [Leucobacter sp.]